MRENRPWSCPACGAVYELPPKACRCEAGHFPMAPSSAFVLTRREFITLDEGLGYIDNKGGLALDEQEVHAILKALSEAGLLAPLADQEMIPLTLLGGYVRSDGLENAPCLLGEIFTAPGIETLASETLVELPLSEAEYQRFTTLVEAGRLQAGRDNSGE